MIICSCRRLNCQDVAAAVEAGARTPGQVHAFHGCKAQCGSCRSDIARRIPKSDAVNRVRAGVPAMKVDAAAMRPKVTTLGIGLRTGLASS